MANVVCAHCKSIIGPPFVGDRDSHGVCADCARLYFPEFCEERAVAGVPVEL